MPRRDEEGWRYLWRWHWKVERIDNHGDRSTTTILKFTWEGRWSTGIEFTRGWKEDE